MHGTIDIDHLVATADSEFPALFQLFSGYLHQDWREDHVSADAAVLAFKDEAPVGALHDALVEIDRLLGLQLDDASLDRVLVDGLGCCYQPRRDGVATAIWLTRIREQLLPQRSSLS